MPVSNGTGGLGIKLILIVEAVSVLDCALYISNYKGGKDNGVYSYKIIMNKPKITLRSIIQDYSPSSAPHCQSIEGKSLNDMHGSLRQEVEVVVERWAKDAMLGSWKGV
jgi:hypothetical protein